MKGVVVRVSSLPASGWGQVQELRNAITRFRASGKPAYAHLEFSGNKEYYLATACTKVYAVPTALLDVTGLETEVTFFRGTLDKLGVQAQFEGVGKYKNAPNQFTEEGFTEPHREQMEALLDSLYGEYVAGIAQSRNLTPAGGAGNRRRGPVRRGRPRRRPAWWTSSSTATSWCSGSRRGGDQARALREAAAAAWASAAAPGSPSSTRWGRSSRGRARTARSAGPSRGPTPWPRALRQAREDSGIKAILLRVDSPGGSGTASDVIWREVELARKSKPVVVSMGDVAASGGYYIAMGSDAIVAQPGTITGSIGVFGGKFSLRGLYDKIGLSQGDPDARRARRPLLRVPAVV